MYSESRRTRTKGPLPWLVRSS